QRISDGFAGQYRLIEHRREGFGGGIVHRPVGAHVIGDATSHECFGHARGLRHDLRGRLHWLRFWFAAADSARFAGIEENEARKVAETNEIRTAEYLIAGANQSGAAWALWVEESMPRIVDAVVAAGA